MSTKSSKKYKSTAHEICHTLGAVFSLTDYAKQTSTIDAAHDINNYAVILKPESVQFIRNDLPEEHADVHKMPDRFKNVIALSGAIGLLSKQQDVFDVITGATLEPLISKGQISGQDLLIFKEGGGHLDSFARSALVAVHLISQTEHFKELVEAFIDLGGVTHGGLFEVVNLSEVSNEKTIHKYLHEARLLLAKNKITG